MMIDSPPRPHEDHGKRPDIYLLLALIIATILALSGFSMFGHEMIGPQTDPSIEESMSVERQEGYFTRVIGQEVDMRQSILAIVETDIDQDIICTLMPLFAVLLFVMIIWVTGYAVPVNGRWFFRTVNLILMCIILLMMLPIFSFTQPICRLLEDSMTFISEIMWFLSIMFFVILSEGAAFLIIKKKAHGDYHPHHYNKLLIFMIVSSVLMGLLALAHISLYVQDTHILGTETQEAPFVRTAMIVMLIVLISIVMFYRAAKVFRRIGGGRASVDDIGHPYTSGNIEKEMKHLNRRFEKISEEIDDRMPKITHKLELRAQRFFSRLMVNPRNLAARTVQKTAQIAQDIGDSVKQNTWLIGRTVKERSDDLARAWKRRKERKRTEREERTRQKAEEQRKAQQRRDLEEKRESDEAARKRKEIEILKERSRDRQQKEPEVPLPRLQPPLPRQQNSRLSQELRDTRKHIIEEIDQRAAALRQEKKDLYQESRDTDMTIREISFDMKSMQKEKSELLESAHFLEDKDVQEELNPAEQKDINDLLEKTRKRVLEIQTQLHELQNQRLKQYEKKKEIHLKIKRTEDILRREARIKRRAR